MNQSAAARAYRWIVCHPLALALLAGLLLRLIGIETRSLQYDDTFSIFLSARSLPEIVSGTAADTMPPLYYFLLHFWMLVSREIWFIRLLSAILSLLGIFVLYRLVERWFDPSAAGWAALLAAISPLQIYHAQDIRMYSLLVLGQLGFAWFFTRIWFSSQDGFQRPLDWVGLILSGWAAMYAHNLAVFALVVPDLFLLIHRRWKLLARLAMAQAIIALGALPWLALLPGQLEKIQHAFWTPRPGLVEVIQAVILFTASMPLPPILLVIAAVLSFQILLMLVIELRRVGRRSPGVLYLGLLLLVPPVLLFIVSYLMRPVFVTRGFLVSSLAYYGLAGFVIARSWARGPGKLIAGAFVLAAALTLPSFYAFNSFPRSPFREASAYLAQAQKPGAVVVHDNKLSYFPMYFYAGDLSQTFIGDAPGSINDTLAPASQSAMQIFPKPDLQTAVGDNQKVFFVTFHEVLLEYQAMGVSDHPALAWLDQNYRRVDQKVFNDLEIYQYER